MVRDQGVVLSYRPRCLGNGPPGGGTIVPISPGLQTGRFHSTVRIRVAHHPYFRAVSRLPYRCHLTSYSVLIPSPPGVRYRRPSSVANQHPYGAVRQPTHAEQRKSRAGPGVVPDRNEYSVRDILGRCAFQLAKLGANVKLSFTTYLVAGRVTPSYLLLSASPLCASPGRSPYQAAGAKSCLHAQPSASIEPAPEPEPERESEPDQP